MPPLRASDRDRDVVVDRLRVHHLAGRLTVEELEERVARAHAAVTLADLDALQEDLPDVAKAPVPRTAGSSVPRMPGHGTFSQRRELAVPVEVAREDALVHLLPALANHGYHLVSSTDRTLSFAGSARPVWTYVVSVLVFSIGLVALLHTRAHWLTLEFRGQGPVDSVMVAHGVASLPVRRMFARLGEAA
ncbi:MAG: DUF1707 domain-containing protein [Solirubrobacteraceae bacterium MAG38_C4-C5]|nr:DUF1707 domain-containing protein [Candidatus Siliceabacter maunaloa]